MTLNVIWDIAETVIELSISSRCRQLETEQLMRSNQRSGEIYTFTALRYLLDPLRSALIWVGMNIRTWISHQKPTREATLNRKYHKSDVNDDLKGLILCTLFTGNAGYLSFWL